MKTAQKRSWWLMLFGLPFAGVAVGMVFWALLPTLTESNAMKAWHRVPAQVLEAKLESHHGDDSTTYKAVARYRYAYNGVYYESARVGLTTGSDNIGDWHQEMASQLRAAHARGTPITVYVNPDAPEQAIVDRKPRLEMLAFYGVFALVFGIAGIGVMIFGWRQRSDSTGVNSPDKPWLSRKDWASPELVAEQSVGVWVLWAFAIIWCALSAPATFAIPGELAKGNWAILVILLFDVIGLGLLAAAVRQTISARRFGNTVLRMDPHPGSVGGQVGGMVAARVPFDEALAFSVKLSCLRTYTTGSGKNRSTHNDSLWQDERWFHATRSADGMSDLWFCFDVPDHLPLSEEPSSDYRHWQLQVNADIPGVDFSRQWSVPVFATGQSSTHAARQMRESREEVMEALENLMNLRQVPGGIRMDYRAGRHWKSGLILLLVGAVFTGIALFVGEGISGFGDGVIASVMGVLGPALVLGGLWQWGNRLQVFIDHSQARIQRSLLGVTLYAQELPLSEVQHIQVVRGSRMQSGNDVTQYYNLKLCTRDGKKYGIGDGFEGHSQGREAANAIATLTRLTVEDAP